MNELFIQKAKNLKLLLTDVDGVLTDSKLCWFTDANGNRPSVLTGVSAAVAKGGTLEIAVRVSTGEVLLVEGLNF